MRLALLVPTIVQSGSVEMFASVKGFRLRWVKEGKGLRTLNLGHEVVIAVKVKLTIRVTYQMLPA